jgi:hypothetical protein
MQESSTNPYIPQESETIRYQTETLHSPLGRIVKIAMIVTGILSVLIGVGLFFLIPRTSYEDKQARIDLGNILQPPKQLAKLVPVSSSQGFTLNYDNQLFTSYAEMAAPKGDGKTQVATPYFENDDLRTKRDYNLVRISPVQSADSNRSAVTDPPQLFVTTSITQQDLKNNEAKPDYKGLSKLSLFIQLSTEKRLSARTADDGTTVSIDASKPEARSINGTNYQKVRYTTKNENHRISNEKYDDCYYTIQNDVPYAACVNNIRPYNIDTASLGEQVLQTLSFQAPKVDDTAAATDKATDKKDDVATKDENDNTDTTVSNEVELPFIDKKPEYNDNSASLKAIAFNQPSVVRIGTLYCADLQLKLESGETTTKLTDACVGNSASGTIVSKDGHIVTTGHAIRYDPRAAVNGYINFADNQNDLLERLDRVLDYLEKIKVILESDANYLRIGAQTGDQEALAKIHNIGSVIPSNYVTATNDAYSYSIQPMDRPIVLDRTTGARPSFAYSDSVIAAKFLMADYDVAKNNQTIFSGDTSPKDIGVLKAEGSFQNASIAAGNDVKTNDILNTLGYPAYSDSSLVIDKIRNMAQVTYAKVDQTFDKDGHRLIQTSTPTTPGSDGGGVFNQAGDLIGVSVYGPSYCPDQQCFANGTIRSSNELLSLLDEQNVSLGNLSDASVSWRDAIDQYFRGNYSASQAAFTQAGSQYGFNQLAAPMQKLAQSKQGSASDTSLANQALGIMIGVLIFTVVITILLAIVFFLQRKRLDSLRVGHYGAAAPAIPLPVAQQAPPVMPAVQPLQQQGTYAPQQWNQQPSQAPPLQQNPPAAPQYGQQPPQPYQAPVQQQGLPPAAPNTPQPPEDPFYRN